MEVLVEQFGSELSVEWTAIRYEGACFGNITDQTLLQTLEFIGTLDPTLFVVLQRVDKPVGLVHLLPCLGSSLLKGILLRHLRIELLPKSLLKSRYLCQLIFG